MTRKLMYNIILRLSLLGCVLPLVFYMAWLDENWQAAGPVSFLVLVLGSSFWLLVVYPLIRQSLKCPCCGQSVIGSKGYVQNACHKCGQSFID